ncbi:DUF6559 family protein [Haloferula sargassicola]|uniref:Uncharacterized protein n=1 Tax=Haloferula sargassicola TaxID=490096 RepID=A0ABP9ULV1_9BACT
MAACEMRPADKKAYFGAVGEELTRRHGKKKYYSPGEVRRASQDRGFPVDIECWAYCMYTSPDDFAALHEATGEVCDYAAMKAEILADLAGGWTFELPDIDLSWLEWPDIDLASLFDWFDWS